MHTRELLKILLATTLLCLSACGGGGSTPPPDDNPPGNTPGGNDPGGNDPGGPEPDTTPDTITIENIVTLPDQVVTLPAFTVKGIDKPISLAVNGDGVDVFYSLNEGKDFSKDKREVQNGQAVVLQVIVPVDFNGAAAGEVSLGTTKVPFSVTSPAPLEIASAAHKRITFTWGAAPEGHVDHFRLLANRGGTDGFDLLAENIPLTSTSVELDIVTWEAAVPGTRYLMEGCREGGECVTWPGEPALDDDLSASTVAYVKDRTPEVNRVFGATTKLDATGREMLVGAPSAGVGGEVQRFRRDEQGEWQRVDFLSGEADGGFGRAIEMSRDGQWLFVGEPSYPGSEKGRVHVYRRSGSDWQTHQSISYHTPASQFGASLGSSGDGALLVVGVPLNDSNQLDSGSVEIYRRNANNIYVRETTLTMDLAATARDNFGSTITVSDDGSWIAVGMPGEDSGSGNLFDNSVEQAGAVAMYQFQASTSTWSRKAIVKSEVGIANDYFGQAIALSADGRWLYVGSRMGGLPLNPDGGSVEVFDAEAGWELVEELFPEDASTGASFGSQLALSDDGNALLVSDHRETGTSKGLQPPHNSSGPVKFSGAVHVFKSEGDGWHPHAYLKSIAPDNNDQFGHGLDVSGDGETIAIGTRLEDGNGTDGPENNDVEDAGAVFVY